MDIARLLSNPTGPLKALLEGPYWKRWDAARASRQPAASSRPAGRSIGARHRRVGWVVEGIVQVLAGHDGPMQAKEVHQAVEALLDEPVRWASVKAALAAGVMGASPRFVRLGRGRYELRSSLVNRRTAGSVRTKYQVRASSL
jgi:hypothetical protein